MLRPLLFAILCLTFGLVLQARPANALECDDQNPDYCAKCEDLEKAYKGKDLNTILVRGRSVWRVPDWMPPRSQSARRVNA